MQDSATAGGQHERHSSFFKESNIEEVLLFSMGAVLSLKKKSEKLWGLGQSPS